MKKKTVCSILVVVLTFVTLTPLALGVRDPPTLCTGTIASGTFASIEVPSGASCTLSAITVTGNVLVDPGATLVVSFATIGGSVLSNPSGAFAVTLLAPTIGGSVVLVGTTGGIDFEFAMITGDVRIIGTVSGFASINHSTIGGNVKLNGNTLTMPLSGVPGGFAVTANTIAGDLKCNGNVGAGGSTAPTDSISGSEIENTVGGSMIGQCADPGF